METEVVCFLYLGTDTAAIFSQQAGLSKFPTDFHVTRWLQVISWTLVPSLINDFRGYIKFSRRTNWTSAEELDSKIFVRIENS